MAFSDLENLIHEALEQIGWDADAMKVAERVKRLNYGLPREDEFSAICGWLGNCRLIHKLDQNQFPEKAKVEFQVPDLLAIFAYKGTDLPFLIEVKTTGKHNKLSFTPKYMSRLKNYAKLLGIPLLIAWKNKWNMWALVSTESFKIAVTNYNLDFESALKNSLLGVLAGDFAYTVSENSGVHICCRKERLISTEDTEDGKSLMWQTYIDDVYFTNGSCEQLRNLSPLAQKIFHSWDLEESNEDTNSHINLHYTSPPNMMLFAHMALTKTLRFESQYKENKVHWRSVLSNNSSLAHLENFRAGIDENLKKGIVHLVLEPEPENMPGFLINYKK